MRILHVITSLRTGGAEKLMVDLLPRLKAKDLDVDLLLFDGTDTPFRREVEAAGIKVFDLGIGGSVYSPLRLIRLLPFMRKYDVVHTHNTAPQIFAALCRIFSKTKLVTTEHGGSNRRRSIRGFILIDKWMYNRYDRVICIAAKTEKNLCEYLGKCKTKILTINNGVDIAKYSGATPSDELERLVPGSRKLIMVAGFRWEKDQDTLIRALCLLPDKFHLFLVGDGVRRPELKALSKELALDDRVHFLGLRTDVAELLHAADYVVMSSHFEGLSLSSVEGMAVGRPMLASDVDGLREVVGGAGILFPHGDSKVLAAEIISLEASPEKYNTFAAACFRNAKRYDISVMAEQYAKCYLNLLKK